MAKTQEASLDSLSKDQQAVISKYSFDVSVTGGQFDVVDPVIRKANNDVGNKGQRRGADIDSLLRRAVIERQAHDKRGEAVKPEPAQAPAAAPTGKVKGQKKPEDKAGVKPAKKADANKGSDKAPPTEISGDDVELDKTGKRAKKSKKEKGVRKDNRYLRAAKVIVGKLDITDAELSTAATMSKATAGHCLEAWKGITAALIEKGWLKLPGKAAPTTGK